MPRTAHPSRSRLARLATGVIACAVSTGVWCAPANGQYIEKEVPGNARGLSIADRLGKAVPPDITLIDTSGKAVTLGERFGNGKPILLTMAYYDCPVLCPTMMNQLGQAFNELDYAAGEDFDLVVVSFDPTNTTMQALQAQEEMLASLEPRASQTVLRSGLGFYTADEANARRLGDAIGFSYRYLPDLDEYSHVSSLTVLSPEGVVSHVFPNYTFRDPDAAKPSRDLRLAMLKASDGEIATSIADVVLSFCYTYDPSQGAFTIAAMRLMRVVGLLTVGGLVVLIGGFRLREVRRRKSAGLDSHPLDSETKEGRGTRAQPVVR
jgi:protein SCO1